MFFYGFVYAAISEPNALVMLQDYPWPGNVCELENVIQRAIGFAAMDSIREVDLPPNMREEHLDDIVASMQVSSFERLLHDSKIKLAETAIRECDGNKTFAARSLGISRAYLHRLIRLGESDQLIEGD